MKKSAFEEDDNEDEETCDEDNEDFDEPQYKDGQITDTGKPFLKLSGTDGNVFSILGRAQRAARTAKMPQEKIDEYFAKAKSGDYDNALRTTMEYFDVE
jgi:hypothetical protein